MLGLLLGLLLHTHAYSGAGGAHAQRGVYVQYGRAYVGFEYSGEVGPFVCLPGTRYAGGCE